MDDPKPDAPAEIQHTADETARSASESEALAIKVARTERYLPFLEAMIIGAAAGASAVLLLYGIKTLGSLRIALSLRYPAQIVLPGLGLLGGFLAGVLVQIAPEVSGSGIPQVRALLGRINLKLDLRSAVVKLIGGVLALGSGMFMGREGPTVQVGAALAAQLSRWLPTSAEHRRQLIAAGAGSGLAAAFNAPIAGVTFVLEELLKEVTPSTVSISLIACFSAAVVENLAGSARAQSIITQSTQAVPVHLIDIAFYIVLGLLAAFFGSAFNTLIMAFLRMYGQTKLPVCIRTAFAGCLSGMIVATMPPILHNYAQLRQLIDTATVPPDLVPLAFLCFFVLVLVAYGSGAPGGLFAPALILGAALGYMVGFAHFQLTGNNLIDVFTQVGMGAFFAAVARVPLTATVIVFEMSGNFGLIPPLMIASVLGSSVGDLLSKGSLYDLLMVWSGIHLHGPKGAPEPDSLRVVDVLNTKMVTLAPSATITQALTKLMRAQHHGLSVVKGRRLVGVITEAQIQSLQDEPPNDVTIASLMKRNPVSVSPFDNLEDILFLFSRYGFDWLPVADDGKFMGTVTRAEVVRKLFQDAD